MYGPRQWIGGLINRINTKRHDKFVDYALSEVEVKQRFMICWFYLLIFVYFHYWVTIIPDLVSFTCVYVYFRSKDFKDFKNDCKCLIMRLALIIKYTMSFMNLFCLVIYQNFNLLFGKIKFHFLFIGRQTLSCSLWILSTFVLLCLYHIVLTISLNYGDIEFIS